jgi:hypothetical protein
MFQFLADIHDISVNTKAIRGLLFNRVKPDVFKFLLKGEFMDILKYNILLPEVGVDVESQILTVTVNGVDDVLNLAKDEYVVGVDIEQDADVIMSLQYVDDAGNKSELTTKSFKALDTLPPAAPGEFGVVLMSETEIPVDPVDPSPEENL